MQPGHVILSLLVLVVLLVVLLWPKTQNHSDLGVPNKDDGEGNRLLDGRKRVRPHVPKFMLEIYENKRGPDVVRSLIPKHSGHFNEIDDEHLIVFSLPELSDGEEFVSAQLKILTLVEGSRTDGFEREMKISIYNDTAKTIENVDHVHFTHHNSTWLSFDMTDSVDKIITKGSHHTEKYLNVILSLKSYIPEDKFKLSLLPERENIEHDYPVLIMSYRELNKRTKRNADEDYEEETNNIWDEDRAKKFQSKHKYRRYKNSCRRKPLYINFSEIDYDSWILQPPGYDAYQCQGKCFYPVAEHLSPTKHAVVQALLHSISPTQVTRSCCVPTILDSISILYVDENGVLTYRFAYKDMVVVECGCR